MQNFLKKISEIGEELAKLELFKIVVNSAILLLASAVSLQFFRLSWLYSVFPPLFYSITKFTSRDLEKKTIDEVSKEYPYLEEKLKTAYDNKEEENEIVRNLLNEVSRESDDVETSRFLKNREMFKKFSLCVVLIFILLSLNFFHLSVYSLGLGYDPLGFLEGISERGIFDIELTPESREDAEKWEVGNYTTKDELKKLGAGGPGGKIPGFSKGPIPGAGGGAGTEEGEDIFGQPSAGEIPGEEVKMEIHPEYGGEITIREERIKKAEETFSLEEAKGAETPTKDPLRYEEIIKRYFEKLLEEEQH